MVRSSAAKRRLLTVLRLLWEHADPSAPLTAPAIKAMLAAAGIEADRRTVVSDIAALRAAGYDVREKAERPRGYYLAFRPLSKADVEDLQALVASAKGLPDPRKRALGRKLEALAPKPAPREALASTRGCNRVPSAQERLAGYYAEHPEATVAEAAQALAVTPASVKAFRRRRGIVRTGTRSSLEAQQEGPEEGRKDTDTQEKGKDIR